MKPALSTPPASQNVDSLRTPRRVPKERPGPAGGKRDENRRRRTDALCQAALSLFLERGIAGVTIDDIVREAGMAKGSFYRYFDDKADLVDALIQPTTQAAQAAFAACERETSETASIDGLINAYQKLAFAFAEIIARDPATVRLYLQECRAPGGGIRQPVAELAEEVGRAAISLTRTAQARGLLRPCDPRISALTVVGAVERILHGVLASEDFGPQEAIAPALISLILDGIRVSDR